jgi:hypothetical protein
LPGPHGGRNHQGQFSIPVGTTGLFDLIFGLSAFESLAPESDQMKNKSLTAESAEDAEKD